MAWSTVSGMSTSHPLSFMEANSSARGRRVDAELAQAVSLGEYVLRGAAEGDAAGAGQHVDVVGDVRHEVDLVGGYDVCQAQLGS